MAFLTQRRARIIRRAALAALVLGGVWAGLDLWAVHRARARLRDKPVSEDDRRLRDPNLTREEWLEIQARRLQPDDYEGAQYLAWGFNHLKRYDRSYPLFVQAAKGGMVSAMIQLGWMSKSGTGTAKDPAAAFRWYSMAQENGNEWGDLGVADCLEHGVGVPADPKRAFDIYLRLANLETAVHTNNQRIVGFASRHVGRCYQTGVGCASNRAEAVKYLTRAVGIPETWGADRDAYRRLKEMGAPLPPPPKKSELFR